MFFDSQCQMPRFPLCLHVDPAKFCAGAYLNRGYTLKNSENMFAFLKVSSPSRLRYFPSSWPEMSRSNTNGSSDEFHSRHIHTPRNCVNFFKNPCSFMKPTSTCLHNSQHMTLFNSCVCSDTL